jgi:hypothetical protein
VDDKQKFDACMELAKFGAGRHDERRDAEWKVTAWMGALAIGAALYRDKWTGEFSSLGLAAACLAIYAVYVGLWLFPLWRGNDRDKSSGVHYRNEAVKILADPSHTVAVFYWNKGVNAPFSEFLKDASMLSQMVATGLLFIALLFVCIHSKTP